MVWYLPFIEGSWIEGKVLLFLLRVVRLISLWEQEFKFIKQRVQLAKHFLNIPIIVDLQK